MTFRPVAGVEKRIGLVPRIVVAARMGMNEYAVLVTDKRSILVLEQGSKSGLAGAIGGTIGAAIAEAAASRRLFDYQRENINDLANHPSNLIIPHESVGLISLKRGWLGSVYTMQITYQEDDKVKKLTGSLQPPKEHVKQRKQSGVAKKQIHSDYARKVQEVYRQALSAPRFESVMTSHL